jgi:hypothetical protein
VVNGTLSSLDVAGGGAVSECPARKVAKLVGPVTKLGHASGKGTNCEKTDSNVSPSKTENALNS